MISIRRRMRARAIDEVGRVSTPLELIFDLTFVVAVSLLIDAFAAALIEGDGWTVLPRFLIYFFYRWETCLRETTALGILGCATLGKHIREVNSKFRYDEMMVLILLGAGIVIFGDLLSALVRRWARRAV